MSVDASTVSAPVAEPTTPVQVLLPEAKRRTHLRRATILGAAVVVLTGLLLGERALQSHHPLGPGQGRAELLGKLGRNRSTTPVIRWRDQDWLVSAAPSPDSSPATVPWSCRSIAGTAMGGFESRGFDSGTTPRSATSEALSTRSEPFRSPGAPRPTSRSGRTAPTRPTSQWCRTWAVGGIRCVSWLTTRRLHRPRRARSEVGR